MQCRTPCLCGCCKCTAHVMHGSLQIMAEVCKSLQAFPILEWLHLQDYLMLAESFHGCFRQCTVHPVCQTIQAVCLVVRSLEKYLELSKVPLSSEDQLNDSMPSQQEQDNVQAVLQEADCPSYWVSASKDGNRESHYRGLLHSC